ncbi:MAG: PD-(D/E)XK nuclease family protein, partial [Actinobacteria bacterium]|nr:PD-(D/E)XK nuclease family protein [Actinomycetota bacterium]
VDAARAGTRLDRIAMLYASAEPYARLVHEQLDGAGIATNGTAVVPVAARMTGRALLRLLALPEAGFRRQDVFAWLAGAAVLHDGRPAPVAAWERLSREAAVVAGSDWDTRLDTLARDLDARAEVAEADPDTAEWRAENLKRDATRARELRRFALTIIGDLAAAAERARPWSDHAAWARATLERLIGDAARRNSWPDVERRAAERVELALQRLGALDSVEAAVDLDVFTRTLRLELEADLGRVGRLGAGVLVGSIGMGVGLDLDLVVVLGLAEGMFPSAVHEDSLLPDRERAAAQGELPLAAERVDRQHRQLLAALATSTHQVLCMPRGDLRRSRELMPSRWTVRIAGRLAGGRVASEDLLGGDDTWLTHVSSFDGGLRRLQCPATPQEFRLRALLAHATGSVADPLLQQATCVIDARRSDGFTRFDGNLAGLTVPSPLDHVTSATRLERWAACPFHYFMNDVLHVEPVENPGEQLRITPLHRGELVHSVLERFVLEVLARPADEQPGPDVAWSVEDRERIRAITDDLCDRYEAAGLTGRPIFWRRDRAAIHADVQQFLSADDRRRRAEHARPIAAELAFGFADAALATAPVELPDGRVLHFRGKADRVDVSDDGTIRVVDYKTGSPTPYRGLSEANPDQRGTRLQLVIYGVAARLHHGDDQAPVHAEYWFVSRRGEFKCIGYPVSTDVLTHVSETLGTIVSGIEAGVFPNHPTATSSSPWVECASCDPDSLGVTELRTRWERKRRNAALSGYAELAEPLDVEAPADLELNDG